MAAHRYWRLGFIYNNGGSALSSVVTALTELQLATSDGTNRVGSGTASASSSNASYPAANAFDGSTTTWWASNAAANPTWLAYDFGAGNTWDIQQITLTSRNDGSYTTQSPTAFYVQYSDDGSTWANYWFVPQSQVVAWTQASSQTFNYLVPAGKKIVENYEGTKQTPPAPIVLQHGAKAPTPGPKTVSGTVTVSGTATGGLLVRAYAKATGEFIGQATTASDGTYSIKCGENWPDVYVIAFDPTTYQAIIYDQVVPG
ncbi:discoidin domain-containing protein [Burkholderia pseudomallei]|uniref:discoidin domain-containing protein n=1 Tax=Burkholderia pseudomallei TaxID=28450 RepID=UPI000A1CA10B|nr:discoidin domain-containing protein [Burkholderia pseudomallei]